MRVFDDRTGDTTPHIGRTQLQTRPHARVSRHTTQPSKQPSEDDPAHEPTRSSRHSRAHRLTVPARPTNVPAGGRPPRRIPPRRPHPPAVPPTGAARAPPATAPAQFAPPLPDLLPCRSPPAQEARLVSFPRLATGRPGMGAPPLALSTHPRLRPAHHPSLAKQGPGFQPKGR